MSIGKSSGSTQYIPALSPEQNADIAARTKLFTSVVGPQYEQFFKGATNLYNQAAPGVNAAAQNLAGTSAQAQQALGGTGESALRTGISGLENIFSPDYLIFLDTIDKSAYNDTNMIFQKPHRVDYCVIRKNAEADPTKMAKIDKKNIHFKNLGS